MDSKTDKYLKLVYLMSSLKSSMAGSFLNSNSSKLCSSLISSISLWTSKFSSIIPMLGLIALKRIYSIQFFFNMSQHLGHYSWPLKNLSVKAIKGDHTQNTSLSRVQSWGHVSLRGLTSNNSLYSQNLYCGFFSCKYIIPTL